MILFLVFAMGCNAQKSETDSSFFELQKLANSGNAQAQSKMGDVYLYGEYNEQVDYLNAFNWYTKAAAKGDSIAKFNLAIMYLNGFGVEKNEKMAVSLYRELANEGDPESQLQLGIRYLEGKGVEKDILMAKKWFEKAIMSGNKEAELFFNKMNSN